MFVSSWVKMILFFRLAALVLSAPSVVVGAWYLILGLCPVAASSIATPWATGVSCTCLTCCFCSGSLRFICVSAFGEEVPLWEHVSFSLFAWNEVTRLSVVQPSTEDTLSAQIKEAQHCSIPGCLHLERRCLHLCHGWLRGADQWVYWRPPWWWCGPQYRRGRPAARAFWNDWQLRGRNQQSALCLSGRWDLAPW